MQNLWERRGWIVHCLDYLGRKVGYMSRDEGAEPWKWRWESTRGTGEQEVVQCEWPSRVWVEMIGKWERKPEKPPGPARLWSIISQAMGSR